VAWVVAVSDDGAGAAAPPLFADELSLHHARSTPHTAAKRMIDLISTPPVLRFQILEAGAACAAIPASSPPT
jgi:hypothetical protein